MAMMQIDMNWFTPDDIPSKRVDKGFSDGVIILVANRETAKYYYTTGCYSYLDHKYIFDPIPEYDTFIAWAYFPNGKAIELGLLGGDADEG